MTHKTQATAGQFVRVGDLIVNLAHVVSVNLPPGGVGRLSLQVVGGPPLTVEADDADELIAALGDHCDMADLAKKPKAKKTVPH